MGNTVLKLHDYPIYYGTVRYQRCIRNENPDPGAEFQSVFEKRLNKWSIQTNIKCGTYFPLLFMLTANSLDCNKRNNSQKKFYVLSPGMCHSEPRNPDPQFFGNAESGLTKNERGSATLWCTN